MSKWETPEGFDQKKENVKYGEILERSYESSTTGVTRKCCVITPPAYDKNKKYPVLYLLHGIGGTHKEWLYGDPEIVVGNLLATGQASEFIMVLPNVRACKNDDVPAEILSQTNFDAFDNFINDLKNDLMPFIEKEFSVSTKWEDTAIAGLSMGGRESLFIGFSMIETFAYIGAFSPAPGLLPYGMLNYGGQFQKDEFTIPKDKKKPKLILICNGNNDSVIKDVPTSYHETLVENGVEHEWYTLDGDHNFIFWKNGLYNFVQGIFK